MSLPLLTWSPTQPFNAWCHHTHHHHHRQTGPNAYEASSFNFFTFPRPHGNHNRRFLCDASSLTFLAQHGFDFNTAIRDGVSYMPARTRDWQLTQVRVCVCVC